MVGRNCSSFDNKMDMKVWKEDENTNVAGRRGGELCGQHKGEVIETAVTCTSASPVSSLSAVCDPKPFNSTYGHRMPLFVRYLTMPRPSRLSAALETFLPYH